jgi:copper chaperone CopZ
MNQTVLWIEGMTCGHCVQSVQKALFSLPGVQFAEVHLSDKKALLRHSGGFEPVSAIQAVEQAGYKAGLIS